MDDESIEAKLNRIEAVISTLATKADLDRIAATLTSLSNRLGRQVTVTEALRSDMRLLTGIAQSILTALQAIVGGYANLSGRITDLEKPAKPHASPADDE